MALKAYVVILSLFDRCVQLLLFLYQYVSKLTAQKEDRAAS